jgi:hypothetical protein
MNETTLQEGDLVLINMSKLLADRPYYEGYLRRPGVNVLGTYERESAGGSLKITPLQQFVTENIIKTNSDGYIWARPEHVTKIPKRKTTEEVLEMVVEEPTAKERYLEIRNQNAQVKQDIHSDDLVSVL